MRTLFLSIMLKIRSGLALEQSAYHTITYTDKSLDAIFTYEDGKLYKITIQEVVI